MKKTASRVILTVMLAAASSARPYTNLSPADVHTRLVNGDTLLLLDVREVSEYQNGHIAEPAGRLPLTPANMPWNSGVLAVAYVRLPRTVDIIVTCGSGGRSASAAAFLESNGFTRVFNMTGGFSSWPYERREGGFGDQSGTWIYSNDWGMTGVMSPSEDWIGAILFPGGMALVEDSMYVELHAAGPGQAVPPGAPGSELSAVYRITALDPFGLSLFKSDSLALPAAVSISLGLKGAAVQTGSAAVDPGMACYIPAEGWKPVPFDLDGYMLFREDSVLRIWNAVSGSPSTAVMDRIPLNVPEVGVYPNPFNGSLRINAPPGAAITIHDLRGRLVDRLDSNTWLPDRALGTGFFFVRIETGEQTVTRRVLYMK